MPTPTPTATAPTRHATTIPSDVPITQPRLAFVAETLPTRPASLANRRRCRRGPRTGAGRGASCCETDHGILLLHHEFDRDGEHRAYETAHVCGLRDGLISSWEERPGSMREFEAAWGTRT